MKYNSYCMDYAGEFVSNLDIYSTRGAVLAVLYLAHINYVSNNRTFGKMKENSTASVNIPHMFRLAICHRSILLNAF